MVGAYSLYCLPGLQIGNWKPDQRYPNNIVSGIGSKIAPWNVSHSD